MKFQHLKIGEQFRYRGETYVKSTPLVAHHAENGVQKLIPRYAEIEPLTTAASTASHPSPVSLTSDQVRRALEQYHELCLLAVQDILPQDNESALQALQTRLGAVRHQVLQQLNLE